MSVDASGGYPPPLRGGRFTALFATDAVGLLARPEALSRVYRFFQQCRLRPVWMAPAKQDFFEVIGNLSDTVLC